MLLSEFYCFLFPCFSLQFSFVTVSPTVPLTSFDEKKKSGFFVVVIFVHSLTTQHIHNHLYLCGRRGRWRQG